MSEAEVRTCPHCGKKLRSHNKRGACSACLGAPSLRPSQAKKARGGEDSVLARMGFEVEQPADGAPPATKAKRGAAPKPSASAAPRWQGQFRALSSALGLNPDAMLETYCREWVEATRSRALSPPDPGPQKLLTAGAEG